MRKKFIITIAIILRTNRLRIWYQVPVKYSPFNLKEQITYRRGMDKKKKQEHEHENKNSSTTSVPHL